MSNVPALRVRDLNSEAICHDGEYVLYWMIANRRARYNFSLQHAAGLASELGKPLIVLEALRCDYPWASDRMHRFVLQGMADNRAAFAETEVRYYAYVELEVGQGSGLLERLAEKACTIVTDDFPCFFIPAMLRCVARLVNVALQAVDSNGLLPMRAADKVFFTRVRLPTFFANEPPSPFARDAQGGAVAGISAISRTIDRERHSGSMAGSDRFPVVRKRARTRVFADRPCRGARRH